VKYRYRVWCHDCLGDEDFRGCFDNGMETSNETFDTPEQADAAGAGYVEDISTWEYDVIDEHGKEVEIER
jgi:hypothetical protein